MKVSQQQLRRIIAEEYAKEEGIEEGKVEDLLAAIKGGPKPDWYDDKKEPPPPPRLQKNTADDTMPLPQEPMSIKDVVDNIYEMVSDMEPEDVAEIFQIVFERLPSVEMKPSEADPESLYSPGAEGRPQVGFKELKQFIRKVLSEGHYHDMGGEDEMYDALDRNGS